MQTNLIAYIAGPYRAKTASQIDDNIDAAKAVGKRLMAMGYIVQNVITMWAHHDGLVSDERFLAMGLALLERSDIVVVQGDYERSSGTQGEIARARELGMPVFYYPRDEAQLQTIVIDDERRRLYEQEANDRRYRAGCPYCHK